MIHNSRVLQSTCMIFAITTGSRLLLRPSQGSGWHCLYSSSIIGGPSDGWVDSAAPINSQPLAPVTYDIAYCIPMYPLTRCHDKTGQHEHANIKSRSVNELRRGGVQRACHGEHPPWTGGFAQPHLHPRARSYCSLCWDCCCSCQQHHIYAFFRYVFYLFLLYFIL